MSTVLSKSCSGVVHFSKSLYFSLIRRSHAVIADGAAMQRVPGSLRFLTKVCRDAKVPLYILNDPRSWGRLTSTSYSTLEDALVDLRRTVTDNVVSSALELREGTAFERGRFVGRWEKEIEWQARDAGRKTSEYSEVWFYCVCMCLFSCPLMPSLSVLQ